MLLDSHLTSQKHVTVFFSSVNDLLANRTSLGAGQVSAYRTFLTRELFCSNPLSWVLNREGWFLASFWFTIEDLLITIYKPCCCTTWVKFIWKPPAVQNPEVWSSLRLSTCSVQSQGRCHSDFWRTHSQMWWQLHPLCHSSAWNELCCSLFGKDVELFILRQCDSGLSEKFFSLCKFISYWVSSAHHVLLLRM